jgi:hypothetical protein
MPSASFSSTSISRAVYFHRAAEQQLTRYRPNRPPQTIDDRRPKTRHGETQNLARPRA